MGRKTKEQKLIDKQELIIKKQETVIEEHVQSLENFKRFHDKHVIELHGRISNLENDLADAYEEQQRLFTAISVLSRNIMNHKQLSRRRRMQPPYDNLATIMPSTNAHEIL